MCSKKPYFPMFVDLSEKKIVVIGGGRVAERRVKTLLKFAQDILVISPAVTEKLLQQAKDGKIRWIAETVCVTDGICGGETGKFLRGADMVLAATDDGALNERIRQFCRERGIFVNVSHEKELCDFYFPAVVIRGNVTVGITSGGIDHVQARKVRERVEDALGEDVDVWIEDAKE